MKKHRTIPIFIPHEGCPHDCAFCNQRKITGCETSVTPADADRLIREGLSTIDTVSGRFEAEAAFFGGSFTALSLETQESFLRAAASYMDRLDGIRVSTRPDAITPEVLELLARYGVTMVELGVQSSDDEVLARNDRGHTFADVRRAAAALRGAGFGLGLQMMIGMYGSTPDLDRATAEQLIRLRPDCVRIYPTLTLRGTRLEALLREGLYRPYDLDTAVRVTADLLKRFRAEGIDVIRVGLHAGEELQEEGNIIAGPFHPAFGELAEGLIWRDRIEAQIQGRGLRDCELLVEAGAREVSKIIGQKKANREYFLNTYGVRLKLKIREEE